jgi:hypothetical protein
MISCGSSPKKTLNLSDMLCTSKHGQLVCTDGETEVINDSILPEGYVCMSEGRLSYLYMSCARPSHPPM